MRISAVKFLAIGFAAFASLVTSPIEASFAEDTDELKKSITFLSTRLKAHKTNRAALYESLIPLLAAIDEYGNIQPEHYVIARATALQNVLNSNALNGNDEELRKSLLALQTNVDKKLKVEIVKYLTEKIQQLTKEISEARESVLRDNSITDASVSLAPKIAQIEGYNPDIAAKRRAPELTAILTGKPPATFTKSEAELIALQLGLTAVLSRFKPQIYIISATYGDIRAESRRSCNATQYLKAQCHGQPNCTLTGSIKTSACGFDPVPFVEDRYKALLVSYACVPGRIRVWEDRITIKKSARQLARLRTSTGSFACTN